MRGHFLLQTTVGDEYVAAVKGQAKHTHAGTEESTAIVSTAQLQYWQARLRRFLTV